MEANILDNISPVDGRYHKVTAKLRDYFSEGALIENRLFTEIEWFKHLANNCPEVKELPPISDKTISFIDSILEQPRLNKDFWMHP